MLNRQRKNCPLGFTLFELLLALAVLTVAATIVLPSFFHGYFQHRAMDEAVTSVMESMLTAKQLAVQSASPCVYEFVPGTNVQQIYSLNNPADKKAMPLQTGIRLEIDSPDLAGGSRLVFREDGSTEGLVVLIVHGTQTQSVQVNRRVGIPQRVMSR